MNTFARVLDKLIQLKDLDRDDMQLFMDSLFGQAISEVEIASALALLRAKGESFLELATAAENIMARARPFPRPDYLFADIVGTGGDGLKTVNISTAAALVCAEAGLCMAKHGSIGVSSSCGSANVLEALGIGLELSPERARKCLDEAGFCFLYAPYYHACFAAVRSVRKALRLRTIFNLLGPLLNPARPYYQVVGVFDPSFCEPMARALLLLGSKRAAVIHGSGLDEVALHGPTSGVLIDGGQLKKLTLNPEDFGLAKYPVESLRGGDVAANAQCLKDAFANRGSPAHVAAIAANAGLMLWLTGKSPRLKEGAQKAQEAMASKKILEKVAQLKEMTHA